MTRIGFAALVLSLALTLPSAAKDKPDTTSTTGLASGSGPLEVYADQGLEVLQDAKMIIARGNTRSVRGNVTLTADVQIAHYRDKQPAAGKAAPPAKEAEPKPSPEKPAAGDDPMGSNSEVWRVEADGKVVIFTATQTAYGDHADYNIDEAVVVLTGNDLHVVTPTDLITAKDSLEYWEQRHQTVARGKAVEVRGDKRIQADVLVADFAENENKQMAIQQAHGYDHVILTTPTEVVTGDKADYLVETGIVTVTGSVKITRGDNQLNGGYAVVNLNTGISQLYPEPPARVAGKGKQVTGLLVPQKKGGATAPTAAATPSKAP
jgi:lipopolysaccharide export system protein LptA